jgi:hypothetical protein
MALPKDMQIVQVVLLASQVEAIDRLARGQRQSRSEFLRLLISDGLVAFSLPPGFSEETIEPSKVQPADPITA